jgi:hypothetical protein
MCELIFKTTSGLSEKWLLANHKDYYENIHDLIKETDITLSERIYLYQSGLMEVPNCLNCNNKVKFIKFSKGYRKFCSKKCSAIFSHKNVNIKYKRIKKLLECNSNKEMREQMTKSANKTKELFGSEKKKSIIEKRNATNIEKYGNINVSNVDYLNLNKSDKISKVLKNVFKEKLISNIDNIIGYKYISSDHEDIEIFHEDCNLSFKIKRYLFTQRKNLEKTICTICNTTENKSNFEDNVLKYIQSNYSGLIKNNTMFEKKYEIDIYLPELKIGIECNGLYWHSEIYKEKNYHVDKMSFFKERDIRIINIWEDDWYLKDEIIKNRILYFLNKINNKKFARKCVIKYTNNKISKEFLNKNHIQGSCLSEINIGLYDNEELISLMTFGKLRKNLGQKHIENNYELLRFCNKIGVSNVGAFSRLLNFFIKNNSPKKIISYCDASFNKGETYEAQKFKFIKQTIPNYFWVNKNECLRLNRWGFRKDILVKQGYDKTKTEIEIMHERGYYRIFDCGSYLYEISL